MKMLHSFTTLLLGILALVTPAFAANSDPVSDTLSVTPQTGLSVSAPLGGTLSPNTQTFTLSNTSAAAFNWTAVKTQAWTTVSPASGSLAAGATTTVTVTLNQFAGLLPPGTQTDIITIKSASGGNHTRDFVVAIGTPVSFSEPLNTNPGWTVSDQWAFGVPTGNGGASQGFADPTSGATGSNVFGVNLAGDYATSPVRGPHSVTAGPFNFSGKAAGKLRFQRWLNTDARTFVEATVEVSNNNATWTAVYQNPTNQVVTDNAWTPVQYDISSVANNQATVYVRWSYKIVSTQAFPMSGWNIDDVELLAYTPDTIAVTLPASVTEGGAAGVGTVSVSPTPTSPLTVTLISSDTTELTVPATVVIAANQSSATFPITPVDDVLLDGSVSVVVSGGTPGATIVPATMLVHDNETAVLTLTTPSLFTEGNAASAASIVTVNQPVSEAVTVTLTSSDTTEATVPATVTIPAGGTSVSFSVIPVNDTLVDGTQPVNFTASVMGWTAGISSGTVADNEARTVTISTPGQVTEGQTIQGTVSLTGQAVSDVIVSLATNNTGAITIPASVTILTGQTTATFPITTVNTLSFEGTRQVQISGSAPTFTVAPATLSVGDNEASSFSFNAIVDPKYRGVPFTVVLNARNDVNAVVASFNGTVGLGGICSDGAITVSPSTVTFVNGSATVQVTVSAAATNVTLRVDDGLGHFGSSNSINVRQPVNAFTELFTGGLDSNDTQGFSYTFVPDGSAAFYSVARGTAVAFPTDPTGGTVLGATNDSSIAVAIPGPNTVSLYGTTATSINVSSNGFITFAADGNSNETIVDHFSKKRIAVLFDDLDPTGGSISYRLLADRIAVTWQNVKEVGTTNLNSAQIELFFNGTIRLTPLSLTATDGLIGLSNGAGIPVDFAETNFSTLPGTALGFTPFAAVSVPEDGTSGSIPFTITTPGVSPTAVVVTATSSNPAVVANSGVTFAGSGANRFVQIVPLANVSGTTTLTLSMTVAGNTVTTDIPVTIVALNDAPSFTKGPDITLAEDTGAQTFGAWATAASVGPANESTQVLSYIVTAANQTFFTVQPAISPAGTLTFTPAANASGSTTISVILTDDGGAIGGGNNASLAQTFQVTLSPINDAPSFTSGPSLTVNEDAPSQTVAWATNVSAGPVSEIGQTLSFIVTNNNNALFLTQPSISSNGALTYRPAANASGVATVSVTLKDNGGTANGGADTSATQNFTISVVQINEAPSFSKGGTQTVIEDSGLRTVAAWASNISAGPLESSQLLTFIVTNNNNALFAVQPAIAPNGTLTFTPALNVSGTAKATVLLKDDGGIANGGKDSSAVQTFTINVSSANDAPVFTKGPDQSVLEESGAQSVPGWATGMSPGPANESTQTVSFLTTVNLPALFSTAPAVAANGTLTFTPATNANGVATVSVRAKDTGGVANTGTDTSLAQTFTITIGNINDAPSFTKGSNQVVNENSTARTVAGWATGISAGPSESTQAITFIVVADNPALFSAGPAVSPTGVLTFTPELNANGIANVTIKITDDGGTANGGINESATQSFTITINAVNQPPSFTKGANQTVNEDAGAQTVAGWATGISAGPPDESTQIVTFNITSTNPSLFAVQPAVATNGTLTFTPSANANGAVTVTVTPVDSGSGSDTGVPQTFSITVNSVNDAPVVTYGPNQTAVSDSGPRTIPGWATISPAPADEIAQTITYEVTTDRPEFFATAPAISSSGTLTFEPADGQSGTATVTVTPRDNGGTSNGGVDTGAIRTFTIDILGGVQLGGRYEGLLLPANGTNPSHGAHGTVSLKGAIDGAFTGKIALQGVKYSIKGTFNSDGAARFGATLTNSLAIARKGQSPLFLTLQLRTGGLGDRLTGLVREGGSDLSQVAAFRVIYSKTNPVPTNIVDPASDKGRYTALLVSAPAPNNGLPANRYPQGEGYATAKVTSAGAVTISGRLANGTAFKSKGNLTDGFRYGFHILTDSKRGSCTGMITFQALSGSDFDATDVNWFRPSNPRSVYYPQGWPSGIKTQILGSRYVYTPGTAVLAVGSTASAELSQGNLAASIDQNFSLSSLNKLVAISPPNPFTLTIAPKTGLVSGSFDGSFTSTFGLRKTAIHGVIFQKQAIAAGYFLGVTEAGSFALGAPIP